uniref:carboxy-terminal domain RNA polymerase II polypeptide A small phosphatase 1-like n=1 Tax=Erigeron canadensis TaxID=72917 RepID=UPI001CB88E24|nr:carboxy-terminal domain RNA polymerase II polypeptide A small phosphatase 1-like [Erigeron canadensis]
MQSAAAISKYEFPYHKPATIHGSVQYPNQKTVDATGPIRPENDEDLVEIQYGNGERRVTLNLKRQYVDKYIQCLSDNNFIISVVSGELDSKGSVKSLSILLGPDLKQANTGPLLPPLVYPNTRKKTVVLDLDETLIHNVKGTGVDGSILPNNIIYDFLFRVDGLVYYILKRPFVDEFLQYLSENNFEIVVFTAATEIYASLVLDSLDPRGLIKHRLSRGSCTEVDESFTKDLSRLGRDLRKVVIVDDRPKSYSLNPKNAIPIKPFIDDLQDDELMNLMGYFRETRDEEFFKEFEKTKNYRYI